MLSGFLRVLIDTKHEIKKGDIVVFWDFPDFLKPCEEEVNNFGQSIKDFINDLTTLIDNIGECVNDTYEEKGLAYLTGNLFGDAAGMYALGKAGDLGKSFIDKKLRNPREYLESLSKSKLIKNWNNAFYGNDSTVVIGFLISSF